MQNLVLGCGPAGLLAAHALETSGERFSIISRRKQTRLGGQYLLAPIPHLTGQLPETTITVLRVGVPDFRQQHRAWNLSRVYQTLWGRYEERIIHVDEITPLHLKEWTREFENIFTTLPAPVICNDQDHHWFRSRTIRVWPWSRDDNNFAGALADNTVIYNTNSEPTWTRSALLWGKGFTEWPAHVRIPPVTPLLTDHRPTETNCVCWDDGSVHRIGTAARWHELITIDDVWPDVVKVVGVAW